MLCIPYHLKKVKYRRTKLKWLVTISAARGDQRGHAPPKCLENMVILCFERHFSKQCSVIRPKSNILAPPKIYFSPPQISGLATPLLVTYLFNGFPGTKNLEQCYNLTYAYWSNRECRPSVWPAAGESFSEICKAKERLRVELQITSAQQHAPIHFILHQIELDVQRTGEGSTKHDRYEAQKAIDSLQGYDAATTSNQNQQGAHLHDNVHL